MDYDAMVGVSRGLGHSIVQGLEAEGIHVAVAFWAKLEEYGEWRFFLASPDFDAMGLFQAYGHVAGTGHADSLWNSPVVSILDMDDPLVKGLRERIRPSDSVRGLHLAGQSFGARSIEDGILEKVA